MHSNDATYITTWYWEVGYSHIYVHSYIYTYIQLILTCSQALDKMEEEWEPILLEIISYKETGTYIMRSGDESAQQLDDHIVMTQAMSFSPYKKPFEARIMTWENKLRITQDVMEEWSVLILEICTLYPIFEIHIKSCTNWIYNACGFFGGLHLIKQPHKQCSIVLEMTFDPALWYLRLRTNSGLQCFVQ